jgi:hypothetical protein
VTKRATLTILAPCLLAILASALLLKCLLWPTYERWRCSARLQALWFDIMQCAEDPDRAPPPDLAAYMRASAICPANLLVCPGTGRAPGEPSAAAAWADYYYVSWGQIDDVTRSYPLMYDRHLSNHSGKGVNVLLVSGEVIWDEGAAYLRHFALEHKDKTIPVPDD